METTEKKAFRKSFLGGFSKQDVNNYIVESTEKYTAQIKEAEEKLLAAEGDRAELSKKLAAAEDELSFLYGIKEKYDTLVIEAKEAADKLSALESSLSEKNTELEALRARVSELSGIESEYITRKTELADIEISARSRAGEIISEAEREANARREALSEELYLRTRDFEEKREEALREMGDTMSGVSRLVDSLKGEVDSMDLRIARIADSAKNNVSCLSAAISDAQDKVSKIAEKLTDN
ncbi:MAG: hypothetical protein IKU65_03205 [Oscillospiraceae bacterium]|nr:hypothetical protein [Oscillospiraceae bacterium]